MKHRLRLLSSKHPEPPLRTETADGEVVNLEVGEPLVFIGIGLEFGARWIRTSPVLSIETSEPGVSIITTENSVYRLDEDFIENLPN
jgi:hypothetical protein